MYAAATIVGLLWLARANAQAMQFDIAAGNGEKTILEFARQSGLNIVASSSQLHSVTTPAIKGEYDAIVALEMMLKGTDLTVSHSAEGIIMISSTTKTSVCDDEGETMANTSKLKTTVSWLAVALGVAQCAAAQSNDSLETVVVTGIRASERAAIDIRRTSVNAVDAIAQEDIGKMPDQNVAESLQRLPGVTIDRTNGVGNGVTVRGLGPQFNTVTVNGRVVATSGAGREFDWELLPSELITGANVFKSPQADINGASIGATIDIHTIRPLDQKPGFQIGGSARANYQELAGSVTPSAAGYFSWKSDNSRLGVAVVVAYDAKTERTDNFFIGASSYPRSFDDGYYGTATNNGGTLCVGSVSGGVCTPRIDTSKVELFRNVDMYHNIVPQTQMDRRKRLGANLTVQYAVSDDLLLTFDGFLSREQDHYHSSGLAVDFSGGTLVNQVVVGGTQTTETVAGMTVPVHNGGTAMSETFVNGTVDEIVEDRPQNFLTGLIGANATWTHGAFTVSLDADVSAAGDHNPHATFQTVREKGVTYTYDRRTGSPIASLQMTNSYPNAATDTAHRDAHYVGPEAVIYNDTLHETRLDSSWKSETVTLSGGLGWSHRKKATDGFMQPNQCAYCGSDVILPADTFFVTTADWMSNVNINTERHWLDWDPAKLVAAMKYANTHADPALHPGGNYADPAPDPAASSDVQETVWTGYVMADFNGQIGSMPVAVNTGFRVEDTHVTSSGFGQTVLSAVVNGTGQEIVTLSGVVPISYSGHYTDILPSLNVRVNILDDLVLRGSASRVISRPTLTDLSTAQSITSNPGNERISHGNPNLLPFRASQAEGSLEWYYNADSLLAITGFYKNIDSFITQGTSPQKIGAVTFIVDTPVNGTGASVKGAELSYRTTFTQLPDPFDGLGTELSYTYVDSDADYTNTAKVTSHYSLEGLSKNSYTAVLFYEKDPVQLRVSFTRRDRYLITSQTQTGVPEFNHGYGQLDVGFQYKLTDNFLFTLDGSNLTDQAEWAYDNVPINTGAYRYTGRRITGGIRVKF